MDELRPEDDRLAPEYRVVVAEDEERVLRHLVKSIHQAKMGFQVVGEAYTGKQALMLIEELKPEVVFTDIRMPVMDGLELLEYLYFHHPYVKAVIISGYAEFEYARRAMGYGVRDYLLKPIEKEALWKVLNELHLALEEEKRALQEKFSLSSHFYKPEEVVMLIKEYLKKHFHENISLSLVAQKFHYNSAYLSRLFAQYAGVNLSRYLLDLRINRAKYLLRNHPELSIKQVAMEVGYPEQSHFSRIFKKITGQNPAEYRESSK